MASVELVGVELLRVAVQTVADFLVLINVREVVLHRNDRLHVNRLEKTLL